MFERTLNGLHLKNSSEYSFWEQQFGYRRSTEKMEWRGRQFLCGIENSELILNIMTAFYGQEF